MSVLYTYRKIRDLEEMYPGNYVSVRGRVVRLFYDKAYTRAYLTLADDSGMVLAKVQNAASQTIFVGAIVNVRAEIAVYRERVYLKTKEISKMQDVENGYAQLADVSIPKSDVLPDFDGRRWIKPFTYTSENFVDLYSVALQEERKLGLIGIGVAIFFIAFFTPLLIGILMLVSGAILILIGLISNETLVKSYESLQQRQTAIPSQA
ncbi:MAG: hypothetical protein ACPLZC_03365 [Candidatus Bathyarchaeales archaeon]